MITPRTGRNARAQRRARVAVVFAIAAALIAGTNVAAPGAVATVVGDAHTLAPMDAADTADDTQDDIADDEPSVRLSLSAGAHGVTQPGAPLTTTVTIDNPTDDTVAAGRVTVELNRTPVTDEAALAAWLDDGEASGTFTPLGTGATEAVAASDSMSLSITAAVGTLGSLSPGVYPLRGSLSGVPAVGGLTTASVLVVSDGSARQITVLVPITATPAAAGLLTAGELTALTAPDGALTAQLDGVAGTSAVLAVDPLIPAAIRALGSAAPATATDWLTRLESLSNERFALQAGDADAAVQARAELPALLTPLDLVPLLDAANFIQDTPAPTPSPTPNAAPAEPALPTNDELTAISGASSGILWPLGEVQTADLEVFDTYLGTDATTILPSDALTATASALVDVDGHRVLSVDAAASAALSDAATATDEATRDEAIAAAIAQLALGAQTSQLIGLERDETRTADALREAILGLSAFGQPSTLVNLESTDAASATLTGTVAPDRADTLRTLLADEGRLTSFASILTDPLLLLAPERIAILRLIGVGTAPVFDEAVTAHRATTTVTLNAVGVQQPSPIQLFTSAAPLPVWVRNDLPWPVNVTLTSRPSDARLDIEPRQDVIAQPASNTRVKVEVVARVGSGELDVDFALQSPTGVHIGVDQTAAVTVRAEWESIGLGVLGGLIGLLLVLGIVRTVIRRRKDSAAETSGDLPAD